MSTDRLAEAQQAMQQGEKLRARKLLSQLLISDQQNEQAWLMMVRLVDTERQVVDCLERVLKINPQNVSARLALRALKHKPSSQSQLITTSSHIASTQLVKPVERKILGKPAREARSEKLYLATIGKRKDIRTPHHKINRSLLYGSLIILFVILIAIIGPNVAPHDPLANLGVLLVGDKWLRPPFNAFQVPGFILGSDQFGRDMLSRILYAVRPTLIMVSVVAIVRLFLGTLIGIGAGWNNGRTGRFLDTLISAALSIPVLMVALGTIAMLGAEIGLLAFIIGFSINGWGETARFVRDQTQVIKGQLYIESARALGASTLQMLVQHILRQIMPMVWMLFTFEISGTLMVTAGLGFLGYYIGGDLWIDVADFVAQRTSGTPELGQMLATSRINLLQPWPLVLTGSVVFITILGFNLLGDGLRSRLKAEFINHNSLFAILSHRFNQWFEQSISYPTSTWFKANRLRPILVSLVMIALAGCLYLYQTRVANLFNPSQAALVVPGGQIWASERIDPYGTRFFNSIGPVNPQPLWVINRPAGFSGSPVISADGTIYIAGLDGTLLALNPDGTEQWQTSLPEVPLGPLALSPHGTIYIADSKGGLSAFSADGNQLWRYSTDAAGKPNHGAIVAPHGAIYYLLETQLGDTLIALLANGQLLWSMQPGTRRADTGLRLSSDGQEVFVKNVVVNANDGTRVDLFLPTQDNSILTNQAHFIVGADGKEYLLAGHVVNQWTQTSRGFNLVKSADWNYSGAGIDQNSGFPEDAGVDPKGDIWIFYSGYYFQTSMYWLDPTGKIQSSYSAPFDQETRLIAIDGAGTSYTCGLNSSSDNGVLTICESFRQKDSTPLWTYTYPESVYGFIGGAMAPGRLYAITPDGNLTALGDTNRETPSQVVTP